MRRALRALGAVAAATLVVPAPARAHGIASVQDLPVPLWLFFYGASIVLVVSFAALGILWRRPTLERLRHGRPLPAPAQRVLGSPILRAVVGGVSVALLVLVTAAAFVGDAEPAVNIAPTFVYVVFWLGLVPCRCCSETSGRSSTRGRRRPPGSHGCGQGRDPPGSRPSGTPNGWGGGRRRCSSPPSPGSSTSGVRPGAAFLPRF